MTKRCVEIHGMLPEYLTDNLPAATRRKVERHLAECPSCAWEFSSLRKTLGLVDLIEDRCPSPELMDRWVAELYEKIGRADVRRGAEEVAHSEGKARAGFGEVLARAIRGMRRKVVLAVAAAVLVLLVGWMDMRHLRKEPTASEFGWYVDHHRTALNMPSVRARFLVPEEPSPRVRYEEWTEMWLPDLWEAPVPSSASDADAEDLLPLETVRRTLDFRPIAPPRISTYILAGARIANGERKSLQLVYTDGFAVVSVFEGRAKRGDTGSIKREMSEGYRWERWRAEGVDITVIGSAATEMGFRMSERLVS